MDLFIVMVRSPSGRYTDSFWTTEQNAIKRKVSLLSSFESTGFTVTKDFWWVWVAKTNIQDAVLGEEKS